MQGPNQSGDFDDFFDTPGRSSRDDIPSKDSQTSMKTPFTSENDDRHRKSVASGTDENVSESDDYSDIDIVKERKNSTSQSFSNSKSSRSESGSSINSQSHRKKSTSKQSKERRDSSSSENSYLRDSRSGRCSRREGRDFKKSDTEEKELVSPESLRSERLSSASSRSSRSDKYSERIRKRFSPEEKELVSRSPTYVRNDGKKLNRRRGSSSSETESSFSDDSENSSRKASIHGKEELEIKHQAWATDGGDSSISPLRRTHKRPKTAKRVSSNTDSFQHKRSEDESQNQSSDSGSDMTDVSPISSPRNGSLNGHGSGNTSYNAYSKEAKSVHHKKYRAMPLQEDALSPKDCVGHGNGIDLNILMKAVSEIEKEKRVKAQTRRVMFEPVQQKPYEKSNYTFSNDDTSRIEKENKRLLQEIMRCMHRKSERKQKQPKRVDPFIKQSTLTASAINRRRDQKRIENENMAFLKRLQNIKPSKGISKVEQLRAYDSTVLHGIPISTLHPMPSCRPQHTGHLPSSSVMGSISCRAYSRGSLLSNASPSVSSVASRQSSRASSRPTSAKMGERPPWNERW